MLSGVPLIVVLSPVVEEFGTLTVGQESIAVKDIHACMHAHIPTHRQTHRQTHTHTLTHTYTCTYAHNIYLHLMIRGCYMTDSIRATSHLHPIHTLMYEQLQQNSTRRNYN